LFGKGPLRIDGRRIIPAYLFEVKTKTRRVEISVGLLQARRDDLAGRRRQAARSERVSAD